MEFIEKRKSAAKSFYKRHERTWPVLFFIGGFLFDLCMLDRIDSPEVIGQQLLYIILLWAFLLQMLKEEQVPVILETKGKLKKFYYHHRIEAMHFLFGTLLNAYMIFYFKSSSLVVSFAFLAFLSSLLVVNELPRFRSMGLSFKFAMLALCTYSFCAYVLPTLIGYMSATLFLFSLLIGYMPFVIAGWFSQRRSAVTYELMKTNVMMPATLVLLVYLGAYYIRIIPPAPLSIPYIGVFHSVSRITDGYKLGHEKPFLKFWQTGDQDFEAQPGDKIYVFFRIFSPTHFADQVLLTWLHKDARYGWKEEDRVPIKIVGGRREGFRGFGYKSNYEPGKWRAQVETMDGREIGRIYFDLELASPHEREFYYDTQ
jgi:hypothetical protein